VEGVPCAVAMIGRSINSTTVNNVLIAVFINSFYCCLDAANLQKRKLIPKYNCGYLQKEAIRNFTIL
jgi:hypothetical protein